jgi:cytochrome b6-f complex iron-sulfur subunit
MTNFTRRDFLKLSTTGLLAASGLIGLGALLRFMGYESQPAAKMEFDLGDGSAYPLGSRTVLPDVPAMLIHTEKGFTAISLVCTHLGCTVEPDGQGFSCPCHGSQYSSEGLVLRGPAQKPLPTLRLEQNANGQLTLYLE